ncbi:MAG TPA: glycoside hydrolase 43 family protein [Opitutales bacterium]|nr:glycoside hydrolase 43 family protein [Opitutales bacterium]
MTKKILCIAIALTAAGHFAAGADAPAPWSPDLGDGTYKNPIIFADYSDPDVTRVGDDFYLVSSSFTCVPGLPILHSKDLVNWTIIGHALQKQVPTEHFDVVQSGGGVWAPSIRFHNGKFYVFYPDPDYGIYMVSATDPAGEWSAPVLVKGGKGFEDPCPLFDDDGKVWLVHAWVGSRSGGKNNTLTLVPLSADATKMIGDSVDIIRGADLGVTTAEGPKFYKLNGYYYIFAPVGGVGGGTQAVFRSKQVTGPYEVKIVLAQGSTKTNGPHQGGLVDTPDGKQWWFIHFQDMAASTQKGNEGRVTHLEPVVWIADGWPVMGNDPGNTGTGEPVLTFKKPDVGKSYPPATPQISDEFNSPTLGLQWQWLANPKDNWFSLTAQPGSLRLFALPATPSLVRQPNLLLQKIPAPAFSVTTKLELTSKSPGDKAGLIIYGSPCAWIGLVKTDTGLRISQTVSRAGANAAAPDNATEAASADAKSNSIYLAFTMTADSRAQFSYSADGQSYTALGTPVAISPIRGSWIGAKFGLFATAPLMPTTAESIHGYADFDWIHVTPATP